LQPILDPTFSEHSYGFRPGRRAHEAVLAAQSYVQAGRRTVVDVDLETFFDRVNHDILIDRLQKRIPDAGVIRLIRAYLNSGIMDGGVVIERHEGTPQGGPLSPLLANVLLDEVDKELERRGHCFVRYADDCNVYVRSRRTGERVMNLLRKLYARLRLKVNETKSAVASVLTGRKFLGYSFWVDPKGVVKRRVSAKAVATFKQRVRALTRRSGGRSMQQVVGRRRVPAEAVAMFEKPDRALTGRSGGRGMQQVVARLRAGLPGWKGYFGLAQSKSLWPTLDEWIRHRLRAIQLMQWKRGKTMFRELRALGVRFAVARSVAANSRRWWSNSGHALNAALPVAHFDRLGVPRLS